MAKHLSQRESITDMGTIKIHNSVIRSVASTAAMAVDGVYKVGEGLGHNLLGSFFKKHSMRGIKVLSDDAEITLKLSIIAEYGKDIPSVAETLQKSVKAAVEKFSGISVAAVDVNVEGVHRPEAFDTGEII